ncbi:MAG: hypothetical protein WC479_11960 [Candidatus Izemoplasmatales bacterium]|jgi:hypothetical protein
MAQEIDPKAIKSVLDSETGKDLKAYLLEKLEELKNIDNIREGGDAESVAIELKAQKKAYYQLMSILQTIITIQDTKEEDKEGGNDFGVQDN